MIFVSHLDDAVKHGLRQRIVTVVERIKSFELLHRINDDADLVTGYLELLHLQVLYAAIRVAKKGIQRGNTLWLELDSIDPQCDESFLADE